ncbi:MAG: hypothetical protein DRR00_14465 [Candidatus Parabeggiatoa sp. nov. 3]|nr:MAG: hypothetical protein DRR00_14465 [Gammaproteobacteria bacterium]
MTQEKKTLKYYLSRYFITGILTIIPIWLTWTLFYFLSIQLSQIGKPGVRAIADTFQESLPWLAEGIRDPLFLSIMAFIFTLVAIYLLGWVATLVIGKRIISLFDSIMNRLPLVQTIYGSSKKLLSALQKKPGETQRVVLIDFPSSQMKTVGFVTQILTDEDTGKKLAAVYVPTTPNPTSGYLELVPLENVVSTDWTMDEAMTFIISGGTVAPDHINYTHGVGKMENGNQ